MIAKLGTILVLHVLGLAVVTGKFKLISKPWGILLAAVYLLGFYLVLGHWLARDPNRIIPDTTLKNDYYWVPPKKLPTFFQDLPKKLDGEGSEDEGNDGG